MTLWRFCKLRAREVSVVMVEWFARLRWMNDIRTSSHLVEIDRAELLVAYSVPSPC